MVSIEKITVNELSMLINIPSFVVPELFEPGDMFKIRESTYVVAEISDDGIIYSVFSKSLEKTKCYSL